MRIFKFYPVGRAKSVFASWDFDCELFGIAFTSFYNCYFNDSTTSAKHHDISLQVDRKDDDIAGLYILGGNIFISTLYLDNVVAKKVEKELFVILMHEIMHWIQYTIYKWKDDRIVEGSRTSKCEAEIMCVEFEKQAKHVMKIYKALKCIQKHEY
jgi:hypothetical protein